MSNLILKLRRLGKKQLVALTGSGVLAGTAILLAFTPWPFLSIAPLAVLLLHVVLQVVLIQYRVVTSLGAITGTRPQRSARGRGLDGETLDVLERVEFLQKRILAALEIERLEAKERQEALLANRNG